MSTGQRYDLYSHDFRVSTHETYARMRDESPVHLPGLDGETPIWFVTRYDDVVALLTDNERFVLDPALAFSPEELAERRTSGALPDLDPRVNTSLLNLDGADHRRLRKLVTMALTPRIVEQLRPRIRQIADELVDRVAPSGRMELVDDFAFPLPITVIAELLGIPVEDQGRFRTWSSAFVTPALTPDPAALAALRSDVSRIPIAVEELLRFDSPVERTITRWVAADVELGGARLARGDLAIAVVGSANRDETQFTDADTLDLDRAENRHVGFGRGPHYCLGAPLARLETEVALATLLERLTNLRLAIAAEDLYWRPIRSSAASHRSRLPGTSEAGPELATGGRCTSTVRFRLACALAISVVAGSTGDGSAKGDPLVLAYASDAAGSLDLFVVRLGDQTPRRVAGSRRDDFSPSWSPSGDWIAYRVNPLRDDTGDIWVMRADGSAKRNLTRTPRIAEWSPTYAPDGKRIAFYSSAAGGDVWVMKSDGTGRRNVTRSGSLNEYPSWSPDGRSLAFNSYRDGQFEIYRATATGRRQRNLTRDAAQDQWPAWSPDGKQIAFMSDRDGNEDVFVMRPDGTALRNLTRTPTLEESHPTWMRDGRLSFTRHGENGPIELWAVDADGSDAIRLDTSAEPVFVFAWKPR